MPAAIKVPDGVDLNGPIFIAADGQAVMNRTLVICDNLPALRAMPDACVDLIYLAPPSMVKIIILQQWYDASDAAIEKAVSDRLSFRRFAGATALRCGILKSRHANRELAGEFPNGRSVRL